ALAARVAASPRRAGLFSLRTVINATGVVLHTNLGRALLSPLAVERLSGVAGAYSNLELDLVAKERGSRYSHVEPMLRRLSGAEDALVVNNNAAAVLLALETLAPGKEVVVSRGELIEIGGEFRIPDIMRRSGARLREVGTTNRTHPRDYRDAIGPDTALLLKVHSSNYRVVGFTASVSSRELADVGRERAVCCGSLGPTVAVNSVRASSRIRRRWAVGRCPPWRCRPPPSPWAPRIARHARWMKRSASVILQSSGGSPTIACCSTAARS